MKFVNYYLVLLVAMVAGFEKAGAQTFTMESDTVYVNAYVCPAGYYQDTIAILVPGTVSIGWQVIASNFPADWYSGSALGVADNSALYSNVGGSIWNGTSGVGHGASYAMTGGHNFALYLDMSSTTTAGTFWMKIQITGGSPVETKNIVFMVTRVPVVSPTAAGTITGNPSVCISSSIILSDTASTGTWSLQNGNATLAVSGHSVTVTGVTAGVDTLKYTVVNFCGTAVASKAVIVSTPPVPVVTVFGGLLGTTVTYSSYQWSLSGTPIYGATNATYSTTTNGAYSVSVTDVNGCSASTAPVYITTAGVANIAAGTAMIGMYPNPASNELTITSDRSVSEVTISNLFGQTVLSHQYHTNSAVINIATLPAGVYLVRINSTDVRKLVKE